MTEKSIFLLLSLVSVSVAIYGQELPEWLEEGYAQRDSNLLYLQCEPAFDPLREDPALH